MTSSHSPRSRDFIDTPVKRYSSGMGLRLGFAVAAFLEPEVLLVDEVLAVGDLEFRKKCLGRIGEVSHEDGRTVVFVSHELNSILSVCPRAMLIDHGVIIADGPSESVVREYEERQVFAVPVEGEFTRSAPSPRYPTSVFRRVRIIADDGGGHAAHGAAVTLEIETDPDVDVGKFSIEVRIVDRRERPLIFLSSAAMQGAYFRAGDVAICTIPFMPLVPGQYSVELWATLLGVQTLDEWVGEIAFDVQRFDPFGIGSTWVPTDQTGSFVPRAHVDPAALRRRRSAVRDQRLVLYSSLAFFPTHWETFRRICVDYQVEGTAFAADTADLPDVHRQVGWGQGGHAFDGISIRRFPRGSRVQRIRALRRELVELNPDAIWLQQEPTDRLTLELLAAMRGSPSTRIVCAVCENQFGQTNAVVKLAGRALWPRIDALAAVATASLDGIWAIGMPVSIPSAVLVAGALPPPNHVEAATLPFSVEEDDFIVGFAGRIVAEKGWRDIAAAVVGLPESFKLVLAGSDHDSVALEKMLNDPRLRGRVAYVGLLERDELWRFYAALNCLVLPSRTTPSWKEQFGGVLADAMAVGLPVVGSSSGAIPEVIGSAGLVFPEGDVDALSICLKRLADGPLLRKQLGIQGRARFEQEFTISAYARKLAALLGLRPRVADDQIVGTARA